ncbi:MAG: carboxypeptidase-like regulatory domain-containing protein [Bacteroidales bacterium]|nr:carboxypeptidase-like regulatory domain-containing protein [Bacteroidales bacterium]
MKKKISRVLAFILAGIILSGVAFSTPLNASSLRQAQSEEDTMTYAVYQGRLLDNTTHEKISYASIFVQGQNVSSISNSQGEFVIKIEKNSDAKNLVISHLGYKNLVVSLNEMKHRMNTLYMEPISVALNQVYVRPGPVDQIIQKVIENEDKNYSLEANQMTGFYRESIQKRSSYVSLAEAVVNIYKAPYKGLSEDQVRVVIGRMGNNVKRMDTLLFKLQGGPNTALLLDIIKNPYVLLNPDMIYKYNFSLENEVKIDNNLFYVIAFSPISKVGIPQYFGKYYVEVGSYALAYAEFRLDLNNPEEAAELFIQKKPAGVKVTPTYADYIVKYKEQNGKWYFNYAKGEASFKVKWKKKLFSSHYTTTFEMAVTDRFDKDVVKFKPRDRFRPNEIFTESMEAFQNKDYWGKYNIIQPNESIESAISKFKRILKREGK